MSPLLISTPNDWGPVLLGPWQQLRRREQAWLLAVVAAILAAGALLIGWQVGHQVGAEAGWRSARLMGTVLAGSALLLAWLQVAGNLLHQNHPDLARLVPGHAARLRVAALGYGLLSATAATALACAWGAAAWQAGPLLLAITAALALAMRHPGLFAPLGLLAMSWQTLSGKPALQALAQQALAGWQAWQLPIALLVLAASVWALRALIGPGDAAHRRQRDARLRMMQPPKGPRSGPAERLFNPLGQRPYDARLARLCATPASATTLPRVWLALGPAAQPVTQLSQTLGALPAIGLGVGALLAFTPSDFSRGLLGGMAMWGSLLCLATAVQTGQALGRTPGEQALMRLCPGVPGGPALNRALSLRSLRWFGAAWALGTAASLAAVRAMLPDDDLGLGLMLGAGMLALGGSAAGLAMLRDWARVPASRSYGNATPMLPALALGLVLLLMHKLAGWGLPAMTALSAACVLPLGAWLWRRQAGLACAWPAGRDAGRRTGGLLARLTTRRATSG